MGGNSSKESGTPSIAANMPLQADISSFKLSIIKTNTSSELTIGNRRMIVLDCPENKYEFTEESGNIHRIHHLIFTGGDDEKRESLSKVLSTLNELQFFQMQNKAGKSFNTRGSDAGTTITLHHDRKRWEVKLTEQSVLKNKTHEQNFKQIEEKAERWFSSEAAKHTQFRSVIVVFSEALVKYFIDELDSGLQLMYSLPGDTKTYKACILTSSTNIQETKVEQLSLPSGEMSLCVGKYSMVSFGGTEGGLKCPQTIKLAGSILRLDISGDKTSLVVTQN
ncbi:hypothetical protein FDP41_002562 [Naegleria fowleri]|uniref:Uncharacterized protein n=1 Tax=Naegleria fowleri TaxID=5763 RepID=A0A6A5BVV1_NAEFO|nr:uncharacterized protein FDP41_002562 [Naegleria fowleri]KAF0978742.1 hypothetical protein FDP41_002562 [Naegleria fowleri]CAG4716480.1 unnamed protein product [Naegleria fowleri]